MRAAEEPPPRRRSRRRLAAPRQPRLLAARRRPPRWERASRRGAGALAVDDLISYGFLPEFVGRFPVHAKLSALTEEEMMHVMTTPRNALLKQYCALFEADGVKLHFSRAALSAIAGSRSLSRFCPSMWVIARQGLPSSSTTQRAS